MPDAVAPLTPAVSSAAPLTQASLISLAELLFDHPGTLVLTGAGMSTDSGIPDYRGPDGQRRVTPMQHGEFVGSSAARQRYWARSFIGWQRFSHAEPNDCHRSVSALQARGVLGPVITQNVDGLHQAAGSRDVTELHGTLAEVLCLTCGTRTDRDLLQARMAEQNPGFEALASGEAPDGSRVSSQIRPDGDIVLEGKRGLDAFASTNLDFILRSKGIKTVVLGGFLTNCCVESTMRSAYEKGFEVVTLTDCVGATSPEEHANAITYDYPMFSKPMTATEFAETLAGAEVDDASRGY